MTLRDWREAHALSPLSLSLLAGCGAPTVRCAERMETPTLPRALYDAIRRLDGSDMAERIRADYAEERRRIGARLLRDMAPEEVAAK